MHLSIHSFTPIFNGETRETDVGILYDEALEIERVISAEIYQILNKHLSRTKIELNKPYKGIDDGFTTYLRPCFPIGKYAGIEIEINQKLFDQTDYKRIRNALNDAMKYLKK